MLKAIAKGKVDQLNYEVYGMRNEMGDKAGRKAATVIQEALKKKDEIRVIFACAPSQNEMLYELLQDEDIDWSKVIGFHMDEYIGLPEDSDQWFSIYLEKNLLSKKKLKEFHFIDGTLDADVMIEKYTSLINAKPIDLVCLGVGENGHIAFNDPPVADFKDPMIIKKVALDRFSRQQQVNDGCFPTIEDVPTHALSLTIPALLKGEAMVCTVPGETKKQAIKAMLNDEISVSCPATILRTHKNAHLFMDKEAYDK